MELHVFSIQMFVIELAYFIAGFIDSVCGGGGLITIPAMMAIGIPTAYLSGTNHTSIIPGNFIAAITYVKNNKADLRIAFIILPFAIISSVIGARVNLLIPDKFIQIFMVLMIPVLITVISIKKDIGSECKTYSIPNSSIVLRSVIIGIVIGFYQGFYGPGGGTFFVLALAYFLRMDFVKANGTTRFIVSFSTVAAAISYVIAERVLLVPACIAMIMNIIGSYAGAKYAIKKGDNGVRRIMMLIIILIFSKVLIDLVN